jgi:hypothetical protein
VTDPLKRPKDDPLEASAETVIGLPPPGAPGETSGGLGATSAFPPPAPDTRQPAPGDAVAPRIPDVTLERALGQGGMGPSTRAARRRSTATSP